MEFCFFFIHIDIVLSYKCFDHHRKQIYHKMYFYKCEMNSCLKLYLGISCFFAFDKFWQKLTNWKMKITTFFRCRIVISLNLQAWILNKEWVISFRKFGKPSNSKSVWNPTRKAGEMEYTSIRQQHNDIMGKRHLDRKVN